MIEYARIPEPLQQSIAIPVFIPPEMPHRDNVTDVYNWLNKKGVLKRQLTYEEMVDGSLLPAK